MSVTLDRAVHYGARWRGAETEGRLERGGGVHSDGLPPKRLLNHLDATNIPESPRVDCADRLSRLFTKPQWSTDANNYTRKLVGGMMFPSRRSEKLAGMIDGRVDDRGDLRPSRADGELGRQTGVDLLGVEGGSTCVVNRDMKVNEGDLLEESRERRNHGLK